MGTTTTAMATMGHDYDRRYRYKCVGRDDDDLRYSEDINHRWMVVVIG